MLCHGALGSIPDDNFAIKDDAALCQLADDDVVHDGVGGLGAVLNGAPAVVLHLVLEHMHLVPLACAEFIPSPELSGNFICACLRFA